MPQSRSLSAKKHIVDTLESSLTKNIFTGALVLSALGFAFQVSSARDAEQQAAITTACAKPQSQFIDQGAAVKACKNEKELMLLKNPPIRYEFPLAFLAVLSIWGVSAIGSSSLRTRWNNQINTAEEKQRQQHADNTQRLYADVAAQRAERDAQTQLQAVQAKAKIEIDATTVQEPIKLGKRITLKPSKAA